MAWLPAWNGKASAWWNFAGKIAPARGRARAARQGGAWCGFRLKNRARGGRVAASDQEGADLWKSRKRAFGAIGRLSPNFITQDGVVPRSKLPEIKAFLPQTPRHPRTS